MASPRDILFLCICVPLAIISRARPNVMDEKSRELSMKARHEQWMAKHGRVYKDEVEQEKRLKVFQENVKRIESFNKDEKHRFTLAVNLFSDLTEEEFKSGHAGFKPLLRIGANYGRFKYENITQAPDAKDWRDDGAVTPIKNQGTCECCWAFTTVATVESLNHISTGELVTLSEQQLLDCDIADKGCAGDGDLYRAFTYIQSSPGIAGDGDYPYTGVQGACNEPGGVTISGFEGVPQGDEEALKNAVSQQPVSIGLDAQGFEFKSYGGGVFDGECTPNQNHALTLVGYGTDPDEGKDYWLIKNSWGEGWGENGFMRIARGVAKCGIGEMAVYPV